MALAMIKSTDMLDVTTVRTLAELAHQWKVSKSEAIRSTSGQVPAPAHEAIAALDRLQRSLGPTYGQPAAWARRSRTARRLSRAR